jgi:sugar-specific transcriptional regulator TrmB
MDKIIDYLKQLNLSDIEARLYVTLLQIGPISVRDLALTIDIKRTTAYFYIDQLVEKGLIIKLVKGSKKLVAAEEPTNLQSLVEKKLATAQKAQEQFPEVLSTIIASLPNSSSEENAEISYYKGLQAAKKVYDDALRGSELRLYVNLSELEKILFPNTVGIDYDMFEKALVKNSKLQIYEILADVPDLVKPFNLEQTASNKRYKFKFMHAHVDLTAPGILMYDNKVAIINGKKGQVITVVLHNTDYFNNSKNLFDYVWSTIPDIGSQN